jgi:putative transposase
MVLRQYTTNAIESVNLSLRKVTKKGSFPSNDAVMKALYLRITELYKKWVDRPVHNWAAVRNQLAMDDRLQARILKYESN